MSERIDAIYTGLDQKAAIKQEVYRHTTEIFNMFRESTRIIEEEIVPKLSKTAPDVDVLVNHISDFEYHLKFSGDTLVFIMHTNVFTFPPEHEVSRSKYVKYDPQRGYFGMIQIYNFLSDSLKYNRQADLGYLLARVFVNRESHFYVDGHRQLGSLYKETGRQKISTDVIQRIVEQAMLFCLDFDLYVPPIETMTEISINQKDYFNNPGGMPTGKRLGFVIDNSK